MHIAIVLKGIADRLPAVLAMREGKAQPSIESEFRKGLDEITTIATTTSEMKFPSVEGLRVEVPEQLTFGNLLSVDITVFLGNEEMILTPTKLCLVRDAIRKSYVKLLLDSPLIPGRTCLTVEISSKVASDLVWLS